MFQFLIGPQEHVALENGGEREENDRDSVMEKPEETRMSGSRLVYTSENGRICPDCEKPVTDCRCRPTRTGPAATSSSSPGDGIARVRRETKGRGGKTVTTISDLLLDDARLTALAGTLKKRCGCGGSAKDGVIVIQGDHAETIIQELQKQGYKAKRAGG